MCLLILTWSPLRSDPPLKLCLVSRRVISLSQAGVLLFHSLKLCLLVYKSVVCCFRAGIKSCKPGGTVVYSTCSLAPTQNDGIIQAVFEDLWNTTKIDIAVENISWMSKVFNNTFRFFDSCRFGQLVLPTLKANFGPMYFCKIKRIN